MDAVFILHALVQQFLNNNKRLYCAFVDFRRAFNSFNRNNLWYKLSTLGINGKILQVIRDMYNKCKACVRVYNDHSEFCNITIGLLEGEVMSPQLFALFIQDMELSLIDSEENGLRFDDLIIISLFFADDMVIFGKSTSELQRNLNNLYEYCTKWNLEVNTDKTKIIVFRKRGPTRHDECFTYNNEKIETVNDFNYLGTVFNYTGNFNLNQEYLTGKGLKALNCLFYNTRDFKLKPSTMLNLFDSLVGSILQYNAEVWGNTKSKNIETLHLKFCKRLLGVKRTTSSMSVYGELGRYPLYVARYVKVVKYWFRLLNTDNIIMQKMYAYMLNDCNRGKVNWVSNVKRLLDQFGFSNVFVDPFSVTPKNFCLSFKNRIVDCFVQKWNNDILLCSVLCSYKHFKTVFAFENYLDIVPKNLRYFLTKLRLSSHPLRIETGRYGRNRVDRHLRYCTLCDKNDIEDEYHFLFVCPAYNEIRKRFMNRQFYVRPNFIKFCEMFKSEKKEILTNVSKYIKEALEHRKNSVILT